MRFTEIADPEDQLALWRLISDNVWPAVAAQARELARQKAQAAATPKIKKIKPKKAPPLPSSQPVLRPTHSSSFSQADLHGLQQGMQAAPQSFTPQNPF